MKYSPVMSDVTPELSKGSEAHPKPRYVPILPDNGRDPELTEYLLKATQAKRDEYYAGLRAKEAQDKGKLRSDAVDDLDLEACADHDDQAARDNADRTCDEPSRQDRTSEVETSP
jgi:hypothetical protein